MSNRTIVEFNHDLAHQIRNDPTGFAQAILSMLNSGVNDAESDLRNDLKHYGVSTSPTYHHSGMSEVVLMHGNGREYFRQRFT